MLYKFLSGLAKGVTHCIFRVKVVGKERRRYDTCRKP